MVSGGARARSGPAPDPQALRRDRKSDAAGWVTLPAEGFKGKAPAFPLEKATQFEPFFEDGKMMKVASEALTEHVWQAEQELWMSLWKKPQAVMWHKLGLELQVAAYVRAFLESVDAEASAGLKTAVLRMAAEIGISLPGMHQLRWKFSEDELAERRETRTPVKRATNAKARLKGLESS